MIRHYCKICNKEITSRALKISASYYTEARCYECMPDYDNENHSINTKQQKSFIKCLECNNTLTPKERMHSLTNYGISLCNKCTENNAQKTNNSTTFAIKLFYKLKEKSIPVELEKFDGHKHIDIAIPKAQINIEVDGQHHNRNSEQALTDLKRTCYSFLKGYYTIRIPNSITKNLTYLEETADYLSQIIDKAMKEREI